MSSYGLDVLVVLVPIGGVMGATGEVAGFGRWRDALLVRAPLGAHLLAACALGASLAWTHVARRFLFDGFGVRERRANAHVFSDEQHEQDAHHNEVADDGAGQPREVHQQDGHEHGEPERDDVQLRDGLLLA